jgi:hypothetical protein
LRILSKIGTRENPKKAMSDSTTTTVINPRRLFAFSIIQLSQLKIYYFLRIKASPGGICHESSIGATANVFNFKVPTDKAAFYLQLIW